MVHSYLVSLAIVIATALIEGHTASSIVVVAFITGTALNTSGGACDGVNETRTRRGTRLYTGVIMAVGTACISCKQITKVRSCCFFLESM